MKKKTCYLFIFDGFADHEISLAATEIRRRNEYQLKTIAITKDPVKSLSGLTIIPDLDFYPEVDLFDIDSENTAMLILPGINDFIEPLVNHCYMHCIPVVHSHQISELVERRTSHLEPII
jgi:hypothetical protein